MKFTTPQNGVRRSLSLAVAKREANGASMILISCMWIRPTIDQYIGWKRMHVIVGPQLIIIMRGIFGEIVIWLTIDPMQFNLPMSPICLG